MLQKGAQELWRWISLLLRRRGGDIRLAEFQIRFQINILNYVDHQLFLLHIYGSY